MIQCEPDSLFQLQTNLIDAKVDMAVSATIDRVVDQISGLRNEMNAQFNSMTNQLHALGNRVTAIETKLGMVEGTRKVVFDRVMDYIFKTVWTVTAVILPYLAYVFFQFARVLIK